MGRWGCVAGKREWLVGAACVVQIGCSSSNEGAPGAGGSGGAAGADGSSGGSGVVECDHVVSSDNDLVLGFGVALATDGSDVFVLKDKDTRRTVQVLRGGNLVDVVGQDNDPTNVYPGGASLVVTTNGFYFDATGAAKRSVYRSSRAGETPELHVELGDASGTTKPPFVADDAYLYMQALAPAGDSLARVSQQAAANSTGTVVSSGVFLGAPLSSMAVTGDGVFSATGGGGMVSLRASSKTPPLSNQAPTPARVGVFGLSLCEGTGVSLQPGSDALFLGCSANDGRQTIYQLPLLSGWPPNDTTTGQGVVIVSGIPINAQAFLVHGTAVYYINESVPGLFRVSSNDGGTPDAGSMTKIMASHGAKHMAADDQNIYVLSSCGLQQAPL